MSSFLAKLEMDGETHNVLSCKYSFEQNMDSTGRPTGTTRGGQLNICIESTGKATFVEWMLSPNKTKNGTVIFYRRDAMSKLQEIKFEKGYCIDFMEEFDSVNDTPMRITLSITAKSLKFSTISFDNSWKVN